MATSHQSRLEQRIECAQASVNLCNLDVGHIGRRAEEIAQQAERFTDWYSRRGDSPEQARHWWLEAGEVCPKALTILPLAKVDNQTEGDWPAHIGLGWEVEVRKVPRRERRTRGASKTFLESLSPYLCAEVRDEVVIPLGKIVLRDEGCDYVDFNRGNYLDAAAIVATNDSKIIERYANIVKCLRRTLDIVRFNNDGKLSLKEDGDVAHNTAASALLDSLSIDEQINSELGEHDSHIEYVLKRVKGLIQRGNASTPSYVKESQIKGNVVSTSATAQRVPGTTRFNLQIVSSYPHARNQPVFYPFGEQIGVDMATTQPITQGGEPVDEVFREDLYALFMKNNVQN